MRWKSATTYRWGEQIAIVPNCPSCNKALPTIMITDERNTASITYPVMDDANITMNKADGLGYHKNGVCDRNIEVNQDG